MRPRLDDFTNGWRRETRDPGIVFIDPGYPEIFYAAAFDGSCRAAILAVNEEQKAQDRAAIKNMSDLARHYYDSTIPATAYSPATGKFTLSETLHIPAKPQIQALCDHHSQMLDMPLGPGVIQTFLFRAHRFTSDANPRHAHRRVTNCVSSLEDVPEEDCGTVIPITDGYLKTPEGDYLHLHDNCPHYSSTHEATSSVNRIAAIAIGPA